MSSGSVIFWLAEFVYLIFHSFKWHSPVMVGKRNSLTMKYIRQSLTFIFLNMHLYIQNTWASLLAQMVKNLPAMQETQV